MYFKNFLHKSIKEIQDYEFHKENCLNLSFKLKKFIFETFKEIFLTILLSDYIVIRRSFS